MPLDYHIVLLNVKMNNSNSKELSYFDILIGDNPDEFLMKLSCTIFYFIIGMKEAHMQD